MSSTNSNDAGQTDSSPANAEARDWRASLAAFFQARVITMLFLGFSAGLPLLLIFSTLSLWLREADVSRSAVTFFSWAALGYSFKFVWAPLVDVMPLPGLSRWLGHRRGWLLLAQLMIILAIITMASIDPKMHLTGMALAAVLLGFSSATQDIVIDACRIESAEPELQALLSATYIAGYRIAMLVAGAGGLKLAAYFGTSQEAYVYSAWQQTYLFMSAVMLVGITTTLLIPEPQVKRRQLGFKQASDYLRFLLLFLFIIIPFAGTFFVSADGAVWLAGAVHQLTGLGQQFGEFIGGSARFAVALGAAAVAARIGVRLGIAPREQLRQTYVEPIADFLQRYGKTAFLILALIALYRISDIVLGVIANVFYYDLGFTKDQIANIIQTFGLLMTLLGGFFGGMLAMRFGVMRILFVGALLAAATNLLFAALAFIGPDIKALMLVVAADNLSAGIASAAFVAYLSSLTNISFTAVQYALFSSLMTLLPKLLAGYSGSWVDHIGYMPFFIITTLLGLPVLLLVYLAARYTKVQHPKTL